MQERERQRKERLREQARVLKGQSRLPPRMEERAREEEAKEREAAAQRAASAAESEAASAAAAFRMRPIPAEVRMPMWEHMQLEEAGRAERISREAARLARRSKLPPRMQEEAESRSRERRAREERERIKADAEKDLTFTPMIRPLPASTSKPAGFRPKPPKPPPPPQPFELLTDAIKDPGGKGTLPAPAEKERVLRDMARDELVLPERRWPYLSTRAPVQPKAPPPAVAVPPPPTTTSTELRRAALEMDKLKRQIEEERTAQAEARRREEAKEATKKVAGALDLPSARDKARREREEAAARRRAFQREQAEKDAAHRTALGDMYARVAQRPFLFQQQGIDAKVFEETQAAYDKFESALKKQGLSDLLDLPR